MNGLYAVLVVSAVLAVACAVSYNGLVRLRNKVNEAWSGIDVQLERRHDLIPNLVTAVQAYATHERELFDEVAAARTLAQAAQGPAQAGPAEAVLGQAVGKLLAVSEAYPALTATQNFRDLQAQLEGTENRIAVERMRYN